MSAESPHPPAITLFTRYHNPELPILRSNFEKIVMWVFECLAAAAVYYFLSMGIGGIFTFARLTYAPSRLVQFPLGFWASLAGVLFLAKIFRRMAVILGTIGSEVWLEYYYMQAVQPVLVVIVAWLVFVETLQPYRGGEYFRGKRLFRQIGNTLFAMIVTLPFIYYGFRFTDAFAGDLNESQARNLLMVAYLVNVVIIIIPVWLALWAMDKLLIPYFPLTPQEKALYTTPVAIPQPQLPLNIPNTPQDVTDMRQSPGQGLQSPSYDLFFPQAGELYEDILSHHPLEADNHTIVIMVGPVRIYLCTRCTAMILGILMAIFFTQLFIIDLDLDLSAKTAFWIVLIMPIVPLTDWGLQALGIRPATTPSRLVTGFILGVTMQLLSFARVYRWQVLLIVAVYFAIFGVLARIRSKLREKEEVQRSLIEKTNAL